MTIQFTYNSRKLTNRVSYVFLENFNITFITEDHYSIILFLPDCYFYYCLGNFINSQFLDLDSCTLLDPDISYNISNISKSFIK